MTNKEEKPIIIFPVNANPPNMGHLIAINTLLEIAKRIVVVVYDNPQVIPTDASIDILIRILSNYKYADKIKLIKSSVDFSKISEIPDEFKLPKKAYTIATTSRHIYANLQSKGYPYLIFITKPIGWKDEFYQIAFMRSITLSNIEIMNVESQKRKIYDKKK